MKRHRRSPLNRLLLVVVLAICTIAIVGSAARAQRVVVGLPKSSVAKYDTIYNAIAKSYDSSGKYLGSPAISWSASPDGIVNVLQSSTGHSAKLEGLREGVALVKITWNGVADSVLVRVTHARVITATWYNNFKFTPSGLVGVKDTMHVGDRACLYGHGIDRRGGSVTGLPVWFKSSNAGVAAIGGGDSLRSPACPDTSIDPVAMAKLLGVAPQ